MPFTLRAFSKALATVSIVYLLSIGSAMGQAIQDVINLVNSGNYHAALAACDEILKSSPEDIDANYYAGVCHTHAFSASKGAVFLESVLAKRPDYHPELFHTLAIAYHYSYRFDEAIAMLERFRNHDDVKDNQFKQAHIKLLTAEINRAKEYYHKPNQYYVKHLGDQVNSVYSEHSPVLASDKKTLYFTSREEGKRGRPHDGSRSESNYFEDIYKVTINPDNTLSKPTKVTDGSGASVQVFDRDSKMLTYRYIKGGNLFVSEQTTDGNWSEPYPLKGINTPSSEGHAFIYNEGNTIIFSSNNKTKKGDKDLFISSINEKGKWSKAQPVPNINSDQDEDSPLMTNQGRTLFFSSRGHGSMGGFDVYRSDLDPKTRLWSQPVNLGYPINTPKDDLYFTFDSTGTFGFISSNREGSYGRRDLYLIGVKSKINVGGKVTPKGYADLLISFRNKRSGQETFTRSSSDGRYSVQLSNAEEYQVTVSRDGQEIISESLEIPSQKFPTDLVKDIVLPALPEQPAGILDTLVIDSKSIMLKGRLYDQGNGNIKNAEVTIKRKSDMMVIAKSSTDNEGRYTISAFVNEGEEYCIDVVSSGQNYPNLKSFKGTKLLSASGQMVSIEDVSVDIRIRQMTQGDVFVLNDIYFDFNSSEIKPESFVTINKLFTMLNGNPSMKVKIHGHTDSQGDKTYNLWLSRQRAKAIVQRIASKGISTTRLEYAGYGPDKPVAPNNNISGRKQNRRCEIEILTK